MLTATQGATERLHDLIRREIEINGNHAFTREHGADWFELSAAEAEVFGLSLDHMPSLIAVWTAFEAVTDMASGGFEPYDPALFAAVRAEHPWLEEARVKRTQEHTHFLRFAKLFGIPYRLAHAWYAKQDFWNARAGVTYYEDEPRDPDIPF